jgi:uncharacterized membrane protein YeaQ/YmgE (transglycosylase-associated protein family)
MENDKKERDKKEKEKAEYVEGLKKTLTPLLFGILAGVISFFVVNPASDEGLLIAILMVMVQKFVYPFLHTSIKGAKDWIYISFMTIFCWFISFTLLLMFFV